MYLSHQKLHYIYSGLAGKVATRSMGTPPRAIVERFVNLIDANLLMHAQVTLLIVGCLLQQVILLDWEFDGMTRRNEVTEEPLRFDQGRALHSQPETPVSCEFEHKST